MTPEEREYYCVVDKFFYDTPKRMPDQDNRFLDAAWPTPRGWARGEGELWDVLRWREAEPPTQGWKVHVSATPSNVQQVLGIVSEYCLSRSVTFKFLRSRDAVKLLNAKYANRSGSGKVITIYPGSEVELEQVLVDLGKRLDGFKGPYILGDLRYSAGPLFVRYGAFTAMSCVDDDGERVPALHTPDGRLVPDHRGVVFSLPDWVTPPAVLEPHLAALAGDSVDFPFDVIRALHFSNGGGIYLAKDQSNGAQVVLREARPHAGLDSYGRDAVKRMQVERDVLTRLAGLDCVPRLLGYRVAWEHHFLVEEYIEGDTLFELMLTSNPLANPAPTPADLASYTELVERTMTSVSTAVDAVHGRGVAWGDLHPSNVIVRPDGQVVLIDFETAVDVSDHRPAALGAPGYRAPSEMSAADADRYALEAMRLATLLPMAPALLQYDPAKAATLVEAATACLPVSPATSQRLRQLVPPTPDKAAAWFATDPINWPAIRDSLVAGIHASATPDRDDRLFPGDPEQFILGSTGLAYGAAGVLLALHRVSASIPTEYVDWIVQAVLRTPADRGLGLYDGAHGVAAVLAKLGRHDEALEILDHVRPHDQELCTVGLSGGVSGIALNLLHFGRVRNDDSMRSAAVRLGDELAALLCDGGHDYLRLPVKAGLFTGMTGPALLFLHLYTDTADPHYLDLAGAALRCDLARCVRLPSGGVYVLDGSKHLPYLDGGSGGIGLVLAEYLRQREDPALSALLDDTVQGCSAAMAAQAGLFQGRAGLIAVLCQLRPDDRIPIDRHVRRLGWHALRHKNEIVFPGSRSRRLSTDLATGSAGVLLALHAAIEGGSPVLPYPVPRPVASRPAIDWR